MEVEREKVSVAHLFAQELTQFKRSAPKAVLLYLLYLAMFCIYSNTPTCCGTWQLQATLMKLTTKAALGAQKGAADNLLEE